MDENQNAPEAPSLTSLLQDIGEALSGTRGRTGPANTRSFWENFTEGLADALGIDEGDEPDDDLSAQSDDWREQENRRTALTQAVALVADFDFGIDVDTHQKLARAIVEVAEIFLPFLSATAATSDAAK